MYPYILKRALPPLRQLLHSPLSRPSKRMLSQASAQALDRLRAYKPPQTQWHNLPLTRRAAVLILLFPDRNGELKVVLTMRASTLRSYAGQAALPGGKAETLTETPFEIARREAYEEIGLPMTDADLPHGFHIQHLCELPTNLAKTELGVRPCVAYLSSTQTTPNAPSVESTLIPRLDPKEVAAVFTAPFHNFLRSTWEGKQTNSGEKVKWYRGTWTDWHESQWRMHNFYIPRPPKSVESTEMKSKPTATTTVSSSSSSSSPSPPNPINPQNSREAAAQSDPLPSTSSFRVFGMTARIMVDAARVAYAEDPEFEHNSHFGDEGMIGKLISMGRFSGERVKGEEITRALLREAAKM